MFFIQRSPLKSSRSHLDEMSQRISEALTGLPWLVWVEDHSVQGFAYASKWKGRRAYRYSVESTAYLANGSTGRGIGTRLYEALFAELRQSKMHVVMGGIALPNDASIAMHEKLGFQKVAHFREGGCKFGKWIDMGYWQLFLYAIPVFITE
jgi:phosphinothricin acetyltransferase